MTAVQEKLQKELSPEFFENVHSAWARWQSANERYKEFTEPELVDYAIHEMDAAKKQFSFALRKAREEQKKMDMAIEPEPLPFWKEVWQTATGFITPPKHKKRYTIREHKSS